MFIFMRVLGFVKESVMIDLIKKLFNKKVIVEDVNMEEFEEGDEVVLTAPLAISEPIFTIVAKIKENPKRLKFSKDEEYYSMVIVDNITKDIVQYTPPHYSYIGYMRSADIEHRILDFTQDEINYIVSELEPIYNERAKRLRDIKLLRSKRNQVRSREGVLKIWENT